MVKSKILNTVVNLLFPPTCMICGERISAICDLTGVNCVCDTCRTSYESNFNEVCSTCNGSVFRCTCGVKMGRGEISPLAKCFFYKPQKENSSSNRIIYAIKHVDDKRITKMMAKELSGSVLEMLNGEGIKPNECIFTFVPRRRAAINKDGFDQGKRLANYTARACGVKRGAKSLLIRLGGREQKRLDAKKRRENIAGALRLKYGSPKKIKGKAICIVDDVVTSGATMKAAEKLLLSTGAKRVIFACVARTKN